MGLPIFMDDSEWKKFLATAQRQTTRQANSTRHLSDRAKKAWQNLKEEGRLPERKPSQKRRKYMTVHSIRRA
jgi:hypothetical protein